NDIVDSVRHGGRLLYVALTRCTRHLSIVYSREPELLSTEGPTPDMRAREEEELQEPRAATERISGRAATILAKGVAQEIRQAIRPDLWSGVVEAIAEELRNENNGNE